MMNVHSSASGTRSAVHARAMISGQHSKHQTQPCITFLHCLVVQSTVEGEQLVVLLVDTAECD